MHQGHRQAPLSRRPRIRTWIARGRSGATARGGRPVVFLGSHDPLLDWAIRQSRSGLATLFDGSLDGLARFRAREGVATGLHVHDPASGESEHSGRRSRARRRKRRPRRLGSSDSADSMVYAVDHASSIRGLEDLAGRTAVPRQAESGAQRLFESQLRAAGLNAGERQLLRTGPQRGRCRSGGGRRDGGRGFGPRGDRAALWAALRPRGRGAIRPSGRSPRVWSSRRCSGCLPSAPRGSSAGMAAASPATTSR